jgi:hypothetical protein
MCAALKNQFYSKKKFKKFKKKLNPKTWKKRPLKLLIIDPQLFFMYWPDGPETEIPYHQKPLNAGLGI